MLRQNIKETRAETTDRIAREIIGTEARKRAAKTERLRQARLAAEQAVVEEAPAKAPRRVAASKASPRALAANKIGRETPTRMERSGASASLEGSIPPG